MSVPYVMSQDSTLRTEDGEETGTLIPPKESRLYRSVHLRLITFTSYSLHSFPT